MRSLVVAGMVVAALTGCGEVAAPGPSSTGAASCAPTVDATLRSVAARIYAQAADGPNVVSATRRLARSPALARSVERGDASQTRAALHPLLKGQIHRIVVTRGGHVLARLGTSPALAPVRGVIRDAGGRPVGQYTLAVGDDAGIVGIIRALTGARVQVLPANAPAPGAATASFAATAFPSGAVRIWLLGAAPAACGATPAETAAATIGAIATRLYRVEATGSSTQRVLRHVACDRRFAAAVAAADPVALRAAIVRFFRTHSLHVVRVRATTAAGQLVGDVGGPFVLAPASTVVRDARGRVTGSVTLAVQDDTGYMKLVHRFTGADVLMRTATGTVPGSASAGGRQPTFSFTATAFPTGPLTVSLFN